MENSIGNILAEWDLRDQPIQLPYLIHEQTEALRSLTSSRSHTSVNVQMKRKETVGS